MNWTLAKQLPLWKKFQKMKQNLLELSVLFLSSFHFMPEDFDMDFHDFDFDTLRDKTNVKRNLRNKFKALASYRRKSFCY